jgi:hypothetical protein
MTFVMFVSKVLQTGSSQSLIAQNLAIV